MGDDHSHHGHNHAMTTASTLIERAMNDSDDHSHMGHDMNHGMDPSHFGHHVMNHTMEHVNMTEGGGGSGHGHGHGMGLDMDMDMKMWFHTGVTEVILFESWKINTVGGLLGSMFGIFLMAMLYEGLKYYREYLFRRSYASVDFSCINNAGDGRKVLQHPQDSFRLRMMSYSHLIQTFLHMVQVTLSYFLMLIFMTYNVWLCIAVVLGACVGFFVFGWKKAIVVDVTEHCH